MLSRFSKYVSHYSVLDTEVKHHLAVGHIHKIDMYVDVLCMQGPLTPFRDFDGVFIIRRIMHDKPGRLFRGQKVTRLDPC